MGGTPIRLEPVVAPLDEEQRKEQEEERKRPAPATGNSKVVSLADRRKK
jgi:hypothetical protein